MEEEQKDFAQDIIEYEAIINNFTKYTDINDHEKVAAKAKDVNDKLKEFKTSLNNKFDEIYNQSRLFFRQ